MAKKTYIGVGNVSKNGKKFYIGIDNVAKKVKKMYVGVNGVAKLVYSLAACVLGDPVLSNTQTGQTGSITGSKTYTFNEETGALALGSTSTYSLSSLYSSKEPVYTSVSGRTLTYKLVTDSATSTTSAHYNEGSATSSSTTSTSDSSISGYTSYSFSSSTGQYSSSGSSTSKSYSSMYSAGTTLYTGFGSSLTYKKVTNKSESTGTVYKQGSFSSVNNLSVEPDDSFSGYSSYSFDPASGYKGLNWTNQTLWSGNSWFSLYSISDNGKTIYRDDYSYSDYGFGIACTCDRYKATATTSTGIITTYTITTYTQGSTYTAASTTTTYTIKTYTRAVIGENIGPAYSYGSPQYISSYTKTSGSLSGYSTMPDFDPDTGWFTAVGSKGSYSLGTLGSSWVYTSVYNASDIHYVEMDKIIDTSQTTSYSEGSWSYVSYEQDTEAVGFYGYGYASVDPDTGEWVGSAYNHYGVMEGDYGSTTFYQISGSTCYQITLEGDGKEVWMTTYQATSVAKTTTTYTIGTYRIYAVEN